ncbi:hypothetical protein KPN_04599 [Klebsiella pneumoniae subsp. pneumoniae MGH 78578]|uniref:Opacity-associated protein A-like N-terminal domain-containing protein n=1 Tax=Klebsiella pneumoniae subsp. pneumoniae (strain ATCC 700721 / MGH 78578) TaxID=272620 RepID=A6THB6_KLEP7|nr:hypothetical protein KPN_04599 [Klebsiella pneumoniae subsp. pneumoniae MGH 78578]
MPGRFELTSTLAKIWHAPDHFRLLDPLPPMHRRGIIAGFLLVIIGILLPSDDSQSPASTSREANLNLQSQSQPQAGGNQAVPLPPITNTPTVSDADQMAPVARSRFRMSSRIKRRRSSPPPPSLINPHHSSPRRVLSSNGGPIASSQAKPWRSCSAIMGCRPLTSTPWRRLKALASR